MLCLLFFLTCLALAHIPTHCCRRDSRQNNPWMLHLSFWVNFMPFSNFEGATFSGGRALRGTPWNYLYFNLPSFLFFGSGEPGSVLHCRGTVLCHPKAAWDPGKSKRLSACRTLTARLCHLAWKLFFSADSLQPWAL